MGANKFGPPGWHEDPDWKGWWGPNPPFHTPVFVLTHHPRPSIEMEGGTTFHFLDASPAEALEAAREAADGLDVRIGGGATVIRDFFAAGLVDHMHVVVSPIVLGRGVRLWDGLEAFEDQYQIEAGLLTERRHPPDVHAQHPLTLPNSDRGPTAVSVTSGIIGPMTSFTGSDDLTRATFTDVELSGARFVGCDLSGVVMRGVQVEGAEVDAPWLFEGDTFLRVNGVDVIPYVDAELNRRFPGRELRFAADPDGLRAAHAALQTTWAATLDRPRPCRPAPSTSAWMASGRSPRRCGTWSWPRTRGWARRSSSVSGPTIRSACVTPDRPTRRSTPRGSASETPTYDEVLAARADRVAMVHDFIAGVTADELAAVHRNPHDPDHAETTLDCLHVILDEEWEHHRYAARDLDSIAATPPA